MRRFRSNEIEDMLGLLWGQRWEGNVLAAHLSSRSSSHGGSGALRLPRRKSSCTSGLEKSSASPHAAVGTGCGRPNFEFVAFFQFGKNRLWKTDFGIRDALFI